MVNSDLQDELKGPNILEKYRKKVSKIMKGDKNKNFLAEVTKSLFQDFETYHRTEVDLVEDGIRLALHEYKSSFITRQLPPGI